MPSHDRWADNWVKVRSLIVVPLGRFSGGGSVFVVGRHRFDQV